MPVINCTSNGKKGKKVQNANKCFTGPDAKKRAEAQQRAIKASQAKRNKK